MTVMATFCALFTLADVLDGVDVFGTGCLAAAIGAFGVPHLFEVDTAQRDTVCLTHDSDGNPVIRLRNGGVITRAVAEQLNALIGETYHMGRAAVLTCDDGNSPAPPNAP